MTAIDNDPVFDTAGEHESVALLRHAIEIVETARPLPLSSSVRIEPGEVLEVLEQAVAKLPEELRHARWLLKEREEFLAKVQREGDAILDEARTRAERMVARQEIVRQAKITAQRTVEEADADARQKKRATEDWCDQHLARYEIVLDRMLKTVGAGRMKLRTVPLPESVPGDIDHDADETGFFDQEA
jgi:hypothetical protein